MYVCTHNLLDIINYSSSLQGCWNLFHSGQAIPDEKNKRMKLLEYPSYIMTDKGNDVAFCYLCMQASKEKKLMAS